MTIILYRQFINSCNPGGSQQPPGGPQCRFQNALEWRTLCDGLEQLSDQIADVCPSRSHWHGSAPAATHRDIAIVVSLDTIAALVTCNKDIQNIFKAYAVIRLLSHWSVKLI